MLEAILMFYLIINIFIWIALAICGLDALESYGTKYAFTYPWIWETLDDEEINLAGKLIVCFLFTIIALPAYLLWLVSLGILSIVYCIAKTFCKVFRKKDRKIR